MRHKPFVSERGHAFVVVGRSDCPWCEKVSGLLDQAGCTFSYVNLSENPDLRNELIAEGIKTVPQVYHHGERIGGYEVTERYLKDAGLLREA